MRGCEKLIVVSFPARSMGVPMRTRRLGVRLWSSVAAEVGGKKDALGMTMGDLAGVLQGAGFEKYRSRQVYEFVHFASRPAAVADDDL